MIPVKLNIQQMIHFDGFQSQQCYDKYDFSLLYNSYNSHNLDVLHRKHVVLEYNVLLQVQSLQ